MLVTRQIFIAEKISKDIFKIHFLVTCLCFSLVFDPRSGIVAGFLSFLGLLLTLVLVTYDDD